jgi:hypothetical protein
MIYFIQMGANGPIKIGYTGCQDAEARLGSLQPACPWPLQLLATGPGELEDERQLHERFSRLRIQGEWFLPDQEIFDAIDGLDSRPAFYRQPKGFDAAAHAVLLALPSDLRQLAYLIADDANVTITNVVIEAIRDGLAAAKPRWDSVQRNRMHDGAWKAAE